MPASDVLGSKLGVSGSQKGVYLDLLPFPFSAKRKRKQKTKTKQNQIKSNQIKTKQNKTNKKHLSSLPFPPLLPPSNKNKNQIQNKKILLSPSHSLPPSPPPNQPPKKTGTPPPPTTKTRKSISAASHPPPLYRSYFNQVKESNVKFSNS